MSTHTEHSAWSPDEADSLDNIDKEIQLVSSSTDSHSASNQTNENGSGSHKKIVSNFSLQGEAASKQSNFNFFHSKSYDNLQAIIYQPSYDDFCLHEQENKSSFKSFGNKNAEDSYSHSYSVLSNHSFKKSSSHIHDQKQNKTKHSTNNCITDTKGTPTENVVISESSNKQAYLEKINMQLTKELDEKNAILSLLQENYERLLFKYAEAQNRIDELRIKFLADKTEQKNFQMKCEILNNCIPHFYNEDNSSKADVKCQKATVTSCTNLDDCHNPLNRKIAPIVSRPSSLPLDNGSKFGEGDLPKATTPTDSEGLSSIITSMSGHSKILNSLDEENQISKKSNFYKSKRNNFLLKENSLSNDPFDKVKNWQNSLPPLEQIETPETTLYNINNPYSSNDTNYKEIPLPKIEKDYVFSDESCPPSWREETHTYNDRREIERKKISPQVGYINESQFYSKKKAIDEREHFHEDNFPLKEKSPSQNNIFSTFIIHKRQKRPLILRCSSLPAYDYDSIKSERCKNGMYIPPLDLNNVTLSDDESYCQQDYYLNKSKRETPSSFISSREDLIDRSIQTSQSLSSCKANISEERVPKQTVSKSTSITPDRTQIMDLSFSKRDSSKFDVTSISVFLKECNECCSDKSVNKCKVCGESISGNKSNRFFGSRSNSCESVHKRDVLLKETLTRRSKPPFKRSVSFGSGTYTPGYCSHEKQIPENYFSELNEANMENFDAYANNLKVRSQVVIKALTAHVNNS